MPAFSSIPNEDFNIFHSYNGFAPSATHRTVWGDQPQNYYTVKPWTGAYLPTGARFSFSDPSAYTAASHGSQNVHHFATNKYRKAAVISYISNALFERAYEVNANGDYLSVDDWADELYGYVCSKVPETRYIKVNFGLKKMIGSPNYPQLAVGAMIGVQHTVGTHATYGTGTTATGGPQQSFTKDITGFCVVVDRDRRLDSGVRKAYLILVVAGVPSLLDSVEIEMPTATIGGGSSPGAMQVSYVEIFHGTTTIIANIAMADGVGYTLTASSGAYSAAGLAGPILSPLKFDAITTYFPPSPGLSSFYGPTCSRIEIAEDNSGSVGPSHVDSLDRVFGVTYTNSPLYFLNALPGSSTKPRDYPKNQYADLSTLGMGTRGWCNVTNGLNLSLTQPWNGIHTPSSPTGSQTKLEIGDEHTNGYESLAGSTLKYGSLVRAIAPELEQQHYETQMTFASSSRDVGAGIVLRTRLTKERGSPGANWRQENNQFAVSDHRYYHPHQSGYAAMIERTGSSFELKLYSYQSDALSSVFMDRIELASAGLTGLSVGTPLTMKFEAQNMAPSLGAGSEFVRLRVEINGTEVSSYTIPSDLAQASAVSQAQLGSNYWLIDQQSNAHVDIGNVGLAAYSRVDGSDTNAKIADFDYFNRLDPTVVQGSGYEVTFGSSVAMQAEDYGATGTLSLDLSWPVVETSKWLKESIEAETGHVMVFARQSKRRRSWSVAAANSTPAQRAYLLSFFESHKGAEIPFSWSPPTTHPAQATETVTVRFTDQDLKSTLSDPGVESFSFSLEEVFDGA